MATQLYYSSNRRLISSSGIANGATIAFYATGTSNLITIYSDANQTTELDNPVTVNAGAEVPSIYYDSTQAVRVLTTYTDGTTPDDVDPYIAPDIEAAALREDLAATTGATGQNQVGRQTVAQLIADSTAARGAGSKWYADQYSYTEAASAATDHDLTTAGGVKLYVDAPFVVDGEALGAVGDDSTDNTTALQAMLDAAARIGHGRCRLGYGTFRSGALTFRQGHVSIAGLAPPGNQGATNQTEIKCASAGITLLAPALTGSLHHSVWLTDITLRGNSTSDTSSFLFDMGTSNYWGFKFKNVAFVDCAKGFYGPEGFQLEAEGLHIWNISTFGFVGPRSVSNIYKNPRCGTLATGSTVNITAITSANPAVVTAAGHTFEDGQIVWIEGVSGYTFTGISETVNNRPFVVKNTDQGAGTFELAGYDGSSNAAYTSGGTVRRASVGYVFRGANDNVTGFDTAAVSSGTGSVQVVIGQEPSFDLTTVEETRSAHVTAYSPHYEACSGHVFVCSGAQYYAYSPDHQAQVTMPWAVRFNSMAGSHTLNHPSFGASSGSYTTEVFVNQRTKATSQLTIKPIFLNDLPSVEGRSDDGWLNYDVGPLHVIARANSAQSIPNTTETQVTLGTEVRDSKNQFSSNTFTCVVPGLYRLVGYAKWAAGVDGASYVARVKVGSTIEAEDIKVPGAATAISNQAEALVVLAAGDTVTLHVEQSSGGAVNLSGDLQTRLEVAKL